VLVTADVTADAVVVHVADDGPEIPGERKESVFEPELDRDHRLGLYLAQRLVTHSDGEIRLADSESCGTVVTVELPQAG
jgi:signal transduction histidine kinase